MAGGFLNRFTSRLSGSARRPSTDDLAGFRRAQRLAYDCALAAARELRPGMSEFDVAARMDSWLEARGVRSFFHKSLAWFGEDTRFGEGRRWQPMPSRTKRLVEGEVVILDTAPIVDGYVGDIGYTTSCGPHEGLVRARSCLLELRDELPRLFAGPLPTSEIWSIIDARLACWGYDNIHAAYPFSVLGHRVYRVPLWWVRSLVVPGTGMPFTLHTYLSFAARGVLAELLGPKHEGPKTGVWAIEPHLGAKGFGAKFEEILVVEEGRAYWLDDDVPHARRDHEKHP